MRTLISQLVLSILVLSVACTDTTSPVSVDPSVTTSGKPVSAPSIQAVYMKYGDIKGEASDVEDAMDIYSGVGETTVGLLLPAVQSVREAAARIHDSADRNGEVDAKDAFNEMRQTIRGFNPTGSAYKLKDVIVSSLTDRGAHRSGQSLDLTPYGRDNAANNEYVLFHIFNGIRIEMEQAGVDSRTIDLELGELFDAIEELSDERPEA